jgi:hypothetical protein
VLYIGQLNLQIASDFYLKSGEDFPQGFSIFEVDVIKPKAHQVLTVYGHFEVGLGEGERNFERLIDEEWESTGSGVDF